MIIKEKSIDLQRSIDTMVNSVATILNGCAPTVYLYGSVTTGDFRLDWSDIDILVLTQKTISDDAAEKLLRLRQSLLEREPDNRCYRSFEGAMLTLEAFENSFPDRVVYWGTSGERITDSYRFNSFSMTELLSHGELLHGYDVRPRFSRPSYDELYADVEKHYKTIRKYAVQTGRSLYSFGWLFDIARGIYTLRTGDVISKTEAGRWALENELCPVPETLRTALTVRTDPLRYKNDPSTLNLSETLGGDIQRFADVLEKELNSSKYQSSP